MSHGTPTKPLWVIKRKKNSSRSSHSVYGYFEKGLKGFEASMRLLYPVDCWEEFLLTDRRGPGNCHPTISFKAPQWQRLLLRLPCEHICSAQFSGTGPLTRSGQRMWWLRLISSYSRSVASTKSLKGRHSYALFITTPLCNGEADLLCWVIRPLFHPRLREREKKQPEGVPSSLLVVYLSTSTYRCFQCGASWEFESTAIRNHFWTKTAFIIALN